MAAAIASGLIRQKRQAREQHAHRPTTHRRRKSPSKKQGLCNGNLVDIFSKVRIFGLKKRRLRRQGVRGHTYMHTDTYAYHTHTRLGGQRRANVPLRASPGIRARIGRHDLAHFSFCLKPDRKLRPFPLCRGHKNARTCTVMSCSALWFTSFRVHPLLKPQIGLSRLSLSMSDSEHACMCKLKPGLNVFALVFVHAELKD